MIQFAKPETIIQPSGSLVHVPPPNGRLLGATASLFPTISDGHYAPFASKLPIEIQRVADGDTYGCTCFSDDHVDEVLHDCQFGEQIDMSDMFTTVASGTVRGQGNSMQAASELKQAKGFVFEKDYPYSRSMTLDQFYAPIPASIYALAATKLNQYTFDHAFLDSPSTQSIVNGLKISPVKVAVEGHYVFDKDGYLINAGGAYNHAVMIFDFVTDANGKVTEFWIYCSETAQFLKARASYVFESPMVKSLKKKWSMQLYKLNGQPAVYFLNPLDKQLVPYADGVISGGDMFKIIFGDYSKAPIQHVDVLPYSIASYSITTKPNS